MRKKELLAEYESLRRNSSSLLVARADAIETRDRALQGLHDARLALMYEADVIESSLNRIYDVMGEIDFVLGVSGFIPPDPS